MGDFLMTDFVRDRANSEPHKTIVRYRPRKGMPYADLTWSGLKERVFSFGAGLLGLGLQPGDRVCILSFNRIEWIVTDLGIMLAGGVNVPIYHTNTPEQCAYILNDSGARFLVVEDAAQLNKILAVRKDLNALEKIILFEGTSDEEDVIPYADFLRDGLAGLEQVGPRFGEIRQGIVPDTLATIVYTSGTTGPPKGCMLSHRNISYVLVSIDKLIQVDPTTSLCLLILPLSHFYPRISGYYYNLFKDIPLALAESMDTLARDMAEVRPTYFCAVPRVFEKVHARISGAAAKGPAIKSLIFQAAMLAGRLRSRAITGHRPLSPLLRFAYKLACLLVFDKVRAALGGSLEFAVSAGAPLSAEVGEFVHSIGIQVIEFYGLSETVGGTMTTFGECRYGTVGKAMPGFEVKLAADGEILIRGNNYLGYYHRPDLTGEVMKDGWFLTGDVGRWDADGFLVITDRKKDLIITSGGKNISPQNIENGLTGSRHIEQAAIIGDNRNYLTALIVPAFAELEGWAKDKGIPFSSRKDLIGRPEVQALFEEEIRRHTRELGRVEQIKKFTLLETEWSQDTDELTPTLKLKRKVIATKFAREIDAMYQGS
jgi:long-chain acyl-CoA synthetase